MKITRDIANAIAALDPPVLDIVEDMVRRKLSGDKSVNLTIPFRTKDRNYIRPTFRSGKLFGTRGEDFITIDENVFFSELREEKIGWKLKSHQREWAEKGLFRIIDPLVWMALKPYTPEERISLLYTIMPNYDFVFEFKNIRIGRLDQNWNEIQKHGRLNQIVARSVTEAYEWKENVLTLKAGVPLSVVKGLESNPVPLKQIIDMGEGFEAEAARYFGSKHKNTTCLKVKIEPINKSIFDD